MQSTWALGAILAAALAGLVLDVLPLGDQRVALAVRDRRAAGALHRSGSGGASRNRRSWRASRASPHAQDESVSRAVRRRASQAHAARVSPRLAAAVRVLGVVLLAPQSPRLADRQRRRGHERGEVDRLVDSDSGRRLHRISLIRSARRSVRASPGVRGVRVRLGGSGAGVRTTGAPSRRCCFSSVPSSASPATRTGASPRRSCPSSSRPRSAPAVRGSGTTRGDCSARSLRTSSACSRRSRASGSCRR